MTFVRSALTMVIALLIEAFLLSNLPVLNVVLPFTLALLVLLLRQLHIDGALTGIVLGSFIMDVWIAATPGSLLLFWLSVASIFVLLRKVGRNWLSEGVIVPMLVLFVPSLLIAFAWQWQVAAPSLWAQYSIISTISSVMLVWFLHRASILLGKVI